MYKTKYNIFYLGMFIFLLLISCKKEERIDIKLRQGDKTISIPIVLNHSKKSVIHTRTTEQGKDLLNENKISKMQIFFFNADGSLFSHPQNIRTNDTPQKDFKNLVITLSAKEAETYKNKSYTIVAIANIDNSAVNSITNIHQLEEAYTIGLLQSSSSPTPQDEFMMDGLLQDSGIIQWQNNSTQYNVKEHMNLYRAAAKIRLNIPNINVSSEENGVAVNYNLVGVPEVRLVHYTQKTSLLRNFSLSSERQQYANTPYRPMTLQASGTQYTTNVPFYSYENNWQNNSENETYLIVRLYLSARGGNAKPYYYRIPVNYRMPLPSMSEEERKNINTIQRNNIYSVSSSISVLGSEDEGIPTDITSNISIEPWSKEQINANIQTIHYLAVQDKRPILPNIDKKNIYYQSDLPIKVTINEVYYMSYNETGEVKKNIVNNPPVTITNHDGYIEIFHKVQPNLFVPYNIDFTITQVMPYYESGQPLSEKVSVIQYPPKYVTGRKSNGLKGGTSSNKFGQRIYADFRFHETLGSIARYGKSSRVGPQINEQLYRITTLVSIEGEKIGDPTGGDSNGLTKNDYEHNQLISPEFIIASQHGMSIATKQFGRTSKYTTFQSTDFDYGAGYGPYSNKYPQNSYVYDSNTNYLYVNEQQTYQPSFSAYSSAEERCANYFEDEYGSNGYYTEYYIDSNGNPANRQVYKTFKYNGKWRLPTIEELKYIDSLQDNADSAVKFLLWGSYYWSAQQGQIYDLNNNSQEYNPNNRYNVRCVFDTYKVNDK